MEASCYVGSVQSINLLKTLSLIHVEVPDFETNLNLTEIETPVNPELLIEKLIEADFDPNEVAFLKKGFQEGFDIGYNGPENRTSLSETFHSRWAPGLTCGIKS